MDKEIVGKVAIVAHLTLTEDELDGYTKDLNEILDYFKILDEAPECEGVGINPIEVSNVMREDEPHMDIDPDILMKHMKTYDNYVRGPRLK